MAQKNPTGTDRDELDRKIAGSLRRAVPDPGVAEPTDEEILRYVDGVATPDQRARVDQSIARSAYTRDRVEILRESLAAAGHGPTIAERVARYVFVMAKASFELLRGSTAPVFASTAGAATRGSAAAARPCYFEFTQPFQDVDAHLKIEHVSRANEQTPSIDVQIKLIAGGHPATDARVTLLRGGKSVDSQSVEANGAATFSGLAQDRYELDVRRGGKIVGKVHLDFLGN